MRARPIATIAPITPRTIPEKGDNYTFKQKSDSLFVILTKYVYYNRALFGSLNPDLKLSS